MCFSKPISDRNKKMCLRSRIPFFGSKGFTLIELMIVVAIIATLAGIAMPSYLRYIQRARGTDVVREIRMIERNIELFKEFNGVFPDSLEQLGDVPKDSWGNPYQYTKIEGGSPGKGKLRKDHNLVPVNTDYDLYSTGEDGESASPFTAKISRDDIVRANNGEFVGLVSDY